MDFALADRGQTRVEGMRAKIKAGGHASPYRLRKQLPEPVFGQIKQARGFCCVEKVRAEWAIVCTIHNQNVADGRLSRLTGVRNNETASLPYVSNPVFVFGATKESAGVTFTRIPCLSSSPRIIWTCS